MAWERLRLWLDRPRLREPQLAVLPLGPWEAWVPWYPPPWAAPRLSKQREDEAKREQAPLW